MQNHLRPLTILASTSPRRSDLLKQIKIDFSVLAPTAEEIYSGQDPRVYVQENANNKATSVKTHVDAKLDIPQGAIIIAADTIVALQDHVLEKPKSAAEAVKMLDLLQGRSHLVHTGVSIVSCAPASQKHWQCCVTTEVSLRPLSSKQIEAYVATREPLDKAGSYGIQGIGSALVEKIVGSYTSVVGLPLAEVIAALNEEFNYRWLD